MKSSGPKILLFGNFDDWFLEGVKVLGYNYKISSMNNLEKLSGKFDIVVFGWGSKGQVWQVLSQVKAVPVLMKGVSDLTDFNAQKERGNCFKYKKNTSFHQLEALVKAMETFKYPYDWKNVKVSFKDVLKYKTKKVIA